MKATSNDDIIAACIRGDQLAQEKLYAAYYGRMMSLCWRYARTEEEGRDIMQEGFVKVFNNLHKYQPGTSLDAWITRIMVNTAIDWYRRNKNKNRFVDITPFRSLSSNEEDPISAFSADDIMKAIQDLPDGPRTAFNLFIMEDHTYQEIADMLELGHQEVKGLIQSARRKLRAFIKAQHNSTP